MQEHVSEFDKLGASIVAVSVDPLETSQKLSDDLKLTFPVAADTDRRLTKALGIFDQANDIAWPAVIVVGADGTIGWSDVPSSYVLDSRPSPEAILKAVAELSD